jgi:hypothetical protein
MGDVLIVDDHYCSFICVTCLERDSRRRHDDRVVLRVRGDRDLRRAIRAQLSVAIPQCYPNLNRAIRRITRATQQRHLAMHLFG